MTRLAPWSRLCQGACRSMRDQGWRQHQGGRCAGRCLGAMAPLQGRLLQYGMCTLIWSEQPGAGGLIDRNAALYGAWLTQR